MKKKAHRKPARKPAPKPIVSTGVMMLLEEGQFLLDDPLAKFIPEFADQKVGVDIVRRALVAPIKQIAKNAGLDGSIVAQKVMESKDKNFGYNALTREYGDMIEFGVIVPVKVERVALQNGASIASLLLTTDAVVSEIPEKKEPAPQMPPGGGMY